MRVFNITENDNIVTNRYCSLTHLTDSDLMLSTLYDYCQNPSPAQHKFQLARRSRRLAFYYGVCMCPIWIKYPLTFKFCENKVPVVFFSISAWRLRYSHSSLGSILPQYMALSVCFVSFVCLSKLNVRLLQSKVGGWDLVCWLF